MLSLDEVRRLARLARIGVDDAAAHALRGELDAILGLVEQMRAVDTAGVEPMSHPQPAGQPLREDRVTEEDRRSRYQASAPRVEDGLYLVPQVIE